MGSDQPRHSVSVAAAVVNSAGEVLVVRRRDNGRWEPPGGVLELDEDIHQGLRREVREETGLDIEIDRLTGVYKNMVLNVVALVFRCRVGGGVLTVNEEATDFRWLSAGQVPRHTAEVFAVRLLDALDGGVPHVRAHDGKVFVDSAR